MSFSLAQRKELKETSTPSKASPIYGEDATQEIAARRRFPSVLVSRDTACIIYRLAHRVVHYLFLWYVFFSSVRIFCIDAHSLFRCAFSV